MAQGSRGEGRSSDFSIRSSKSASESVVAHASAEHLECIWRALLAYLADVSAEFEGRQRRASAAHTLGRISSHPAASEKSRIVRVALDQDTGPQSKPFARTRCATARVSAVVHVVVSAVAGPRGENIVPRRRRTWAGHSAGARAR